MLFCAAVQPQNFVYPPYGIPLVEAYDGRYESVFIVLHPFIRVPKSLSWSVTRQYPSDAQVLAAGSKFPWTEVVSKTGLGSCARVNQALLTSTGSLTGYMASPVARNALQSFLQSEPVWMPTEGRFEPLLQPDLLRAFETVGCEELIFVPEFPNSDPVVRLGIDELKVAATPFPNSGTLLAPDRSFLFTVDWDSFFTLFYGSRCFVTEVARSLALEGFFAAPNTDHAWFNYSMGCATVTISPEDWQTA